MRWRGFIAAAALLLLCSAGCDRLGNPPMGYAQTDWVRWREGPYATLTRARSAPTERWHALLEEVPRGEVYHADRFARRGGVVAVVTVRNGADVPLPPRLELLTEFELVDGTIERRRWQVPRAARWYGAFALPEPPRSAATAMVR